MRARLKYLMYLIGIIVVCCMGGFLMLNALIPIEVTIQGDTPIYPFCSGFLVGFVLLIIGRQEERMGYLSNEEVGGLSFLGLIIAVVQTLVALILDHSVEKDYITLRWIFVMLTFINLLILMHLGVAETAHLYYSRIQPAEAQEALHEGTQNGLSEQQKPV